MKVRHFSAALLLAFGIGQHVYAEDAPAAEAPKTVAASDAKDAATTSHDKSSRRHAKKRSRHAEEAPVVVAEASTDSAPAKTDAAPVKTDAAPPAAEEKAPAAAESAPPAKTETAQAQAAATPPAEPATPAKAETASPVPAAALAAVTAGAATPVPAPQASRLDSFFFDVKITDVLLAIFAGLLVLLGWEQARRMREAVGAAKESATVAEKSARVAEDALISGQRAFMFIREIKTYLHQDPQTGKHLWTIHPVWANSGNTPTKGLSINTTYRLLDAPLPQDFDFPHAREDLIPTIAGPKSMVEAVPGTLSSEDLEAVQQGKKFFYIWGWAEYHDIFEGTKKHITRFCNQLTEVEGNANMPYDEHNPVQMLFGFHTENNFAD
ncbi:MAG TPA: hypothetical protein VJ698_00425 [Noviherbaspirillum sp.]|uniref:hypothetical protein n=1 Tax=Noviherbaspirillum sp. TaxID=1926288 RepID=UPI002B45C7F2|nr:hypothetical protein [Noviherbaspirillum sp.]HJV83910.1 hypothetical protein [Noviherbaspirillum sp.]